MVFAMVVPAEGQTRPDMRPGNPKIFSRISVGDAGDMKGASACLTFLSPGSRE